MNDSQTDPLAPQRVRHDLQVRRAAVTQVQRLSANFVNVRLQGEALRGFTSASFDDHFKLMLPARAGADLVLPQPGPDGLALPPGAERPQMRDYTPYRFDPAAGELEVVFFLHGDGAASGWAAQARVGDEVGVGGPRGSFVWPSGFDWQLLVGDETALPAIARRLAESPASLRTQVVAQSATESDRAVLDAAMDAVTHPNAQVAWVGGNAADALATAVAALTLPDGQGFAWAAGESASMAAVRQVLVGTHALPKHRVRASAYWKRGASAHHENL
ncbi:MAG: siderophore-interacting protein [Hydrogenophaga sp.]|uniref:siderophore-interacting protein n=1 Tax=Hydrogenophaga sp. TaxID=1904254 RepID=UPI001DC7C830|nr:siderophore-interacting protein [Hydrogenophaga sp.]MBX3611303.1 siderophore-interacting protein [Hydrogenophaga sp.]